VSDDIDSLRNDLRMLMDQVINRVAKQVDPSDLEGMSLFEQWHDAVEIAMKYADNAQAVQCATDHWIQLSERLKKSGVTCY
jgi:hypothetical protein